MRWLELAVEASPEAADAVVEAMARLGHSSTVVEATAPGEGERAPASVSVRTYVPLNGSASVVRSALERELWHLGLIMPLGELEVRELAEEDWANAWKRHFEPLRVGKRLVIKPTWCQYAERVSDVVVQLDPGMAFGTGLHPSTRLCLEELEACLRPGMHVADVGTGSGILSLAAAHLGAAKVVALDTDPTAVSVARANVAASNLEGVISVLEGSAAEGCLLAPPRGFDLVLANIVASVLCELAPALACMLSADGLLLACGIVDERCGEVEQAFAESGLRVIHRREEGHWRLLTCALAPARCTASSSLPSG